MRHHLALALIMVFALALPAPAAAQSTAPDVAITVSVQPTPSTHAATALVTVTNEGEADATSSWLTILAPASLAIINRDTRCAFTPSSQLVCAVPALAPSVTAQYRVLLLARVCTALSLVATVDAVAGELDTANNLATVGGDATACPRTSKEDRPGP